MTNRLHHLFKVQFIFIVFHTKNYQFTFTFNLVGTHIELEGGMSSLKYNEILN